MKLQQIKAVGRKIAQTVFDPRRQVLAAVSFHRLARQTSASFRGHHNLVLSALLKLSNQAFAAAIAIHVGGIDKIYSAVNGLLQRSERFVVRNAAPCAADRPRAKADVRNLPSGASKLTVLHRFLISAEEQIGFRSRPGSAARKYDS